MVIEGKFYLIGCIKMIIVQKLYFSVCCTVVYTIHGVQ